MKSDHRYPGQPECGVVVVLYAEIGTKSFGELHTKLQQLAKSGEIDYYLRHYLQEVSYNTIISLIVLCAFTRTFLGRIRARIT